MDQIERVIFCCLIFLLVLAGFAEMFGMAIIFVYLSILSDHESDAYFGFILTGLRHLMHDSNHFHFVILSGLILVLSFIAKNIFSLLIEYSFQKYLMIQYHKIITAFLDRPDYISSPLFKRNRHRPFKEVWIVFQHSFKPVFQIISAGTLIFMISIFLFSLEPVLTTGLLICLTCLGYSMSFFPNKAHGFYANKARDAKRQGAQFFRVLKNGTNNLDLSQARPYFNDQYLRAKSDEIAVYQKRHMLRQVPFALNEIVLSVVIAGSVVYFTFVDANMPLIMSTLAVFGYAGLRLSRLFSKIIVNGQLIHQSQHEREDVFNEMAALRAEEHVEFALSPEALALNNSVRIENLSYVIKAGAENKILSQINLEITRGQFIGLVGPSGAGKTTLIQALAGLIRPSDGTIFCDQVNIAGALTAWQCNVGLLQHQPFLMKGSVRDNIAFGVYPDDVDHNLILHVLNVACLDDCVNKLPKGLDSVIDPSNSGLSQGEIQRLALARVLYKKPEFLMIDEGLSGLNTQLQTQILSNILKAPITLIVVSHRPDMLKGADVICVMGAGKIIASGAYQDLILDSKIEL